MQLLMAEAPTNSSIKSNNASNRNPPVRQTNVYCKIELKMAGAASLQRESNNNSELGLIINGSYPSSS